jgi:pimeloyl-ACP methyl ester carboxylesterase
MAQLPQGFRNVDIGGRNLNMLVVGQGSPAVILESGLGAAIGEWALVQPRIQEFTCVIAYDRAGYGLSDPATSASRSAEDVVGDLHAALRALGIQPPYVLVGHSAGGFYIRSFAHRFSGEVAGLILVDPSAEGWVETLRTQFPQVYLNMMAREASEPEPLKTEIKGRAASEQQMRAAWPLPEVPVILLTAIKFRPDGSEEKIYQQWYQAHQEFLDKIKYGTHLVATNSDHNIQFDQPGLIVAAVSNLVMSVRGQRHVH